MPALRRGKSIGRSWNFIQAEHVIREQLKIKETPDLLCSLGEVTDEFEYFERAWTLSKERNGRAQRLMGKYYFSRGNVSRNERCGSGDSVGSVVSLPSSTKKRVNIC